MAIERRKERQRAKKGLGARDATGQNVRATPEGRHRVAGNETRVRPIRGKPHGPRAVEARRRTLGDNPDRA